MIVHLTHQQQLNHDVFKIKYVRTKVIIFIQLIHTEVQSYLTFNIC